MRLIWSDPALVELEEIIAYIEHDSPQNADLVRGRVVHALELLESTPFIGKPLRAKRFRRYEVPRTGYFLTYSVSKSVISIDSIRRGKRT